MTNIKSYTDFSQSKILSKLLSYESADMYYSKHDTIYADTLYDSCDIQFFQMREYIPCWSLAALLNEISEVINFNDDENDYALKILKENGLYYLSYDNPLEHGKIEIEPQDNLIDAGYEMIIKLHELNLL
jgi:hypothetical protein